jgi:hypothetical protein
MEDRVEDRVKDHVPAYERPAVTDYGTLLDLTLAGGSPNADVPKGPANTAFSAA